MPGSGSGISHCARNPWSLKAARCLLSPCWAVGVALGTHGWLGRVIPARPCLTNPGSQVQLWGVCYPIIPQLVCSAAMGCLPQEGMQE